MNHMAIYSILPKEYHIILEQQRFTQEDNLRWFTHQVTDYW